MSPAYFEAMFRGKDDPWDLETSNYEQAKFDHSIAALDGRYYRQGFEVGCAKGVLSERLAACCHTLLSVDVSETALAAARKRVAHLETVTCECMMFPQAAPERRFDLVVLSEVAYYWDDADLARAAEWLGSHLEPEGDLLLVHFIGETDYPQSGDEAVEKLFERLQPSMAVIATDRQPRYRLDLWRRMA